MTVLQAAIVLLILATLRFGVPVAIMMMTNLVMQWQLGVHNQ